MSPQEFVVVLRLRLGIAVFPRHPMSYRCTCNHVLDEHGDHALGCGPLRIKRHDAVCEVIYHCLLKENAGTPREQGCSTLSFDRLGDVYHPDFSQGKPAYFDVSVRNSFSPSHIINAASKAGVAAEAGECEKDLRHDENVAAAGGIFYPLIVETYGVWSMHSLEVLKSIAKKTSLFNELTFSRTLCNLHKQLSCKLWQYNAKLIVDKLALFSYDTDSFNIVF